MYPFGYQFATSRAIRFKSEEQAQEALWTLRGNGRIYYDNSEDEECRIRINSGYDSRTLEEHTAEFQLRKLRSAIKYHEVRDETYRTDWRQCKTWFLPDGKLSKRICVARWNNALWKFEFLRDIMKNSKLWQSIRLHWNFLIETETPDADLECETDEEPRGAESANDWSANDWSANDWSADDEGWYDNAY